MQGEICDIDGTCVDAADDEIFKLTTKGGSLSMEREKVRHHYLHPTSVFCCVAHACMLSHSVSMLLAEEPSSAVSSEQ